MVDTRVSFPCQFRTFAGRPACRWGRGDVLVSEISASFLGDVDSRTVVTRDGPPAAGALVFPGFAEVLVERTCRPSSTRSTTPHEGPGPGNAQRGLVSRTRQGNVEDKPPKDERCTYKLNLGAVPLPTGANTLGPRCNTPSFGYLDNLQSNGRCTFN